ncbi:AMP-binding enzyme [Escherichia coli]
MRLTGRCFRPVYATFDWGIRDAAGLSTLLAHRHVINVAGHRLGTREIEENISSHPGVAEVAVVGVKDALKGRWRWRLSFRKRAIVWKIVMWRIRKRRRLWRWWTARSATSVAAHVRFVLQLPKTRSGKTLRRTIQAICEGRDPGISDDH